VDQGTLVEEMIVGGRRFVERFAADGNPVRAAFWIKTAEEGIWFLYVASEIIDRDGPAAAYRAVDASLRKLDKPEISSSAIKVISPSNPIAQDVLPVLAHYQGRRAVIHDGDRTAGSMEEIYVYPSHYFTFTQPKPMTTEEIGREILRLMNRGSSMVRPSRIALKDGTTFTGVPFALELGAQGAMVVRLVADGEVAPRVVPLDEISSIA
jgi:hypothetical protein